jgi:tetratricopeptide (TPR) repeat protein
MYYSSYKIRFRCHAVSAVVLFFFSLIAFESTALAGFFSNVAEDYHRSGYQAQLKGDFDEAVTYYYKAVNVDPDNASYFNDLGLAYEHLDRIDDAEQSYLQAIKLNRNFLPPYTNLGFLYKRQQNLAKAASFFQQRIDLGDPTDPWTKKTREELENLYDSSPLFKEKFLKAEAGRMNLQVSEFGRRNFKNQMIVANAEYERGLQLRRSNKFLEAVRAFNSSLAFAPQNPKVIEARDEALQQYRKEQVVQRTQTAIGLLEQGKDQAAKQQFNEILSSIPDHP